MTLKFALTALLGLFVSSVSVADQMGPNGDKFYEEAAHYENACGGESCKGSYTHKVLYSQKSRLNNLTPEIRDQIKKVAAAQTQIWGDTILEGDYRASGRVRLDKVLAFYKKNRLVGYKIQYSEKAWFVGECNYNGSRESLVGCQEGRIAEGSYVSADLQTFFSDEERYAEFSLTENI